MRWTAIVFVLVLGVTAVWWWNQPRTPAELLDARCSECHVVPSMKLLEKMDTERLIVIMREAHGAKQVISESEAQVIIDFLESRKDR